MKSKEVDYNNEIFIPETLKRDKFRFYLINKDSKIPLERDWNRINNYRYDDPVLVNALKNGFNYGVVLGIERLFVIDFDNPEFYNMLRLSLPYTFSVQTATKKLYHYYFYLKGNKRLRNISIREGDELLGDLLSSGRGVVAPNSRIGNNQYKVHHNTEIAEIDGNSLGRLLNRKDLFEPKRDHICYKNFHPLFDQKTKNGLLTSYVLEKLGLVKMRENTFKCPFHDMKGKGNLVVFKEGGIYCFHESRSWWNIYSFLEEYVVRLNKKKINLNTIRRLWWREDFKKMGEYVYERNRKK